MMADRKMNESEKALPPVQETAAPPKVSVAPETWIGLAILVLTLAVYCQVVGFNFVTFDDPLYITRNTTIQSGLTWKSVRYAFTTGDDGSYLPLVWLSHAACVSLFKTWAGGHHLVNLALHCANSLLLFHFLKRLSKKLWPSAAVAFLFALHPLHVESVAWVTERKDVLSTLFWILTSWAYLRYTERPSPRRYLKVCALFFLGLLSKSMLVTLPVTLLFFDLWPLGRIRWEGSIKAFARGLRPLLLEKIPLFALSVLTAAATFYSQKAVGAVATLGSLTLRNRLGNAALTTVTYLQQMVWPANLSAFYPISWSSFPVWRVAGALLFLLAVTALCVHQLRRRPYLAVGWFWYLITLLPVVGIIQVGSQAHADRYTYVPLIGIFIMLAWLADELVLRWAPPRKLLLVVGAALLGVLVTLTTAQTYVWKDNLTLFKNALSLDTDNPVALMNIGDEYMRRGHYSNAYAAYFRALKFSSGLYLSYTKTGLSLELMGRDGEAMFCYWHAYRLRPDLASVNQRMGHLLVRLKHFDEAEPYVQRVIQRHDLDNVGDTVDGNISKVDWATILASRGLIPEALKVLSDAFPKPPNKARMTLGIILQQVGQEEAALQHLRTALELDPKDPHTLYSLSLVLIQLKRFGEAQQTLDRLQAVDPQSSFLPMAKHELEKAQKAL